MKNWRKFIGIISLLLIAVAISLDVFLEGRVTSKIIGFLFVFLIPLLIVFRRKKED